MDSRVVDGWERPKHIERVKLLSIGTLAAITWMGREYIGTIKRQFLPGYSICGTYPWEVRYELQDYDNPNHGIILDYRYFRAITKDYLQNKLKLQNGKANLFSGLTYSDDLSSRDSNSLDRSERTRSGKQRNRGRGSSRS